MRLNEPLQLTAATLKHRIAIRKEVAAAESQLRTEANKRRLVHVQLDLQHVPALARNEAHLVLRVESSHLNHER